jgi:hypothetical protein
LSLNTKKNIKASHFVYPAEVTAVFFDFVLQSHRLQAFIRKSFVTAGHAIRAPVFAMDTFIYWLSTRPFRKSVVDI